jgi:DNA-binding response OmpR family regulator
MAKKVLIADDEPLTAEMLALVFAYRGYEVVSAADGVEALARAKEVKPDALLLDALMPELEGVAVARAVRDDPELGACTVVLFSSADESEIEWREAGADLFLQKPVDVRKLPELVDNLLLHAAQPAASRPDLRT